MNIAKPNEPLISLKIVINVNQSMNNTKILRTNCARNMTIAEMRAYHHQIDRFTKSTEWIHCCDKPMNYANSHRWEVADWHTDCSRPRDNCVCMRDWLARIMVAISLDEWPVYHVELFVAQPQSNDGHESQMKSHKTRIMPSRDVITFKGSDGLWKVKILSK